MAPTTTTTTTTITAQPAPLNGNTNSHDNVHAPENPILVLIAPKNVGFRFRFRSILQKMHREVRFQLCMDLESLDATVAQHADCIAGFVVCDGSVMESEHEALSLRLTTLVETPEKQWSVIFAFEFPIQAARAPLKFSKYMRRVWGLEWTMCGATSNKIKMAVRENTLRKVAARVYRPQYLFRGVFLKGVKLADKLLVASGEFSKGGQPDRDDLEYLVETTTTPEEELQGDSVLGDDSSESNADEEGDDEAGHGHGHGHGTTTGSHINQTQTQMQAPTEAEMEAVFSADEANLENWADDEDNSQDEEPAAPGVNVGVINSAGIPAPVLFLHGVDINSSSNNNNTTSTAAPAPPPPALASISSSPSSDITSPSFSTQQTSTITNPIVPLPPHHHHQQPIQAQSASSDADISTSPPSDWVPSDDEGTLFDIQIADSPVVIHQVKSWTETENGNEELTAVGYVGFVGHVQDNRSVSSLILGICGVCAGVGGSRGREEEEAAMAMATTAAGVGVGVDLAQAQLDGI